MTDKTTPTTEEYREQLGTLEHVDPHLLVLDENVRDVARLVPEFAASVRQAGTPASTGRRCRMSRVNTVCCNPSGESRLLSPGFKSGCLFRIQLISQATGTAPSVCAV
jgi:hypothetical protein